MNSSATETPLHGVRGLSRELGGFSKPGELALKPIYYLLHITHRTLIVVLLSSCCPTNIATGIVAIVVPSVKRVLAAWAGTNVLEKFSKGLE